MCVDRVQCKSPFLNVTVVVIDDCLDCGVGGVSMNSLAVRELTGRSLEDDNTEKVKVEWFLFDCSAATQVSTQTSPPPPPPPLPTPQALVAEQPPAPEERAVQEKEVATVVSLSPPAMEEEQVQVQQLAPTPSPEIEQANLVEELPVLPIVDAVVPAPELETIVFEDNPVPVLVVDPPIAEIPAAILPSPLTPASEPEIVQLAPVEEPVAEIITTPSPPPRSPPLLPPSTVVSALPAPTVEVKQQQSYQQNTSNNKNTQTSSYDGLPGEGVHTRPRVGKVGLAVPFDYQPFPVHAFANIACGFASVSSYFETHFAGLAASNEACGSCLAVRCAEPSKCPYGTETVVQVVDTCGTCSDNDVNISPDAYEAVIGKQEESQIGKQMEVTWRKVPCRGQTEGSMYLHMINGGSDNEYYAQMSFSNAAQEIQSVRINEQSLTKMSSIGGGRWEWANNGNKLNLALPATFEVTGLDGKVVKVELQKFESQELPSGGQI